MAAAQSFKNAYRTLKKGPLAPAYYLTGDEDVLKDELVTLIVDRVLDATSRDFNFDVRAAGDLNGESLHALVETPPMLAEQRVVVVKNLEQWRKNAKVWQVLERYLDRPSPTTVLVLTAGPGERPHQATARAATHLHVAPLGSGELLRWVTHRAKQAGFAISPEAAQHLVAAVGANLSQLAMEIDKLAAAAPPGGVDIDLVGDLVGVRRGETVLDWVDAIVSRDVTRAVSMLETVLSGAGVTAVRMLFPLGIGLLGTLVARTQLDAGKSDSQARDAVARALKSAPWFRERSWKEEAAVRTTAAARWTRDELIGALGAAYECDRALKSTTVSDPHSTLTQMILSMSPLAEAA